MAARAPTGSDFDELDIPTQPPRKVWNVTQLRERNAELETANQHLRNLLREERAKVTELEYQVEGWRDQYEDQVMRRWQAEDYADGLARECDRLASSIPPEFDAPESEVVW